MYDSKVVVTKLKQMGGKEFCSERKHLRCYILCSSVDIFMFVKSHSLICRSHEIVKGLKDLERLFNMKADSGKCTGSLC